jgi:hypothetical protein
MSIRGAEDARGATSGAPAAGERRGSHHRVHFEALVAVGEAKGAGGFEAESIDVSPEGMRLRTAYLPTVGDRLVCRFDGDAGEIVAEGEVTWRREQPRGGEFGLRFVNFDSEEDQAALRALCNELGGAGESAEEAGPTAIPGTRVRLHIEGLGSPMKARVRDSSGGEVNVGSNLEFLKVGRPLEIEDMDHGQRRPAIIDGVKVEIDPTSRVPQLVVALRFDDVKDAKDAKKAAAVPAAPAKEAALAAPAKEAATAAAVAAAKTTLRTATLAPLTKAEAPTPTPGKDNERTETVEDAESAPVAPVAKPRKELRSAAPKTRPSVVESEGEIENEAKAAIVAREEESAEDDAASDPSLDAPAVKAKPERDLGAALRSTASKGAEATREAFGKIGPAVGRFGSRAKGAMGGLLYAIRKRRAAEGEGAEGGTTAARRMTAPPPIGALKSAGRKLVRNREETETDEAQAPTPQANRKAALLGSALGLTAVLLVVGAIRLLSGARTTEGAQAQAPEAAETSSALALPAPATDTTAAPADANATPTANVPLFGATPLSTTEPVPVAPPEGATAQPALGDAAQGDTGAQAAAMAPNIEDDGAGDDSDSEDASEGGSKQFGKGNVHNPVVLKIKTDGPVQRVNGAAGAMGFTVSLPGRRALSSAAELARKDKRIASINVINNPAGAEISIQFKDGVPAYMAKAKGDRIDIALGSASKKVAKASSSKKTAAAKKKPATAKKKPAAKKP